MPATKSGNASEGGFSDTTGEAGIALWVGLLVLKHPFRVRRFLSRPLEDKQPYRHP